MNNNPTPDKPKTAEDLRELALCVYGTDPNLYGGQRDGYVKGYSDAIKDREQYARQKVERALEMVCKKNIMKLHCGTKKQEPPQS